MDPISAVASPAATAVFRDLGRTGWIAGGIRIPRRRRDAAACLDWRRQHFSVWIVVACCNACLMNGFTSAEGDSEFV